MRIPRIEGPVNGVAGVASLPFGWTTIAPLLCAIHCVAAPVLVALAPALSKNEMIEVWLLALTVLLAGAALRVGVRSHRRGAIWIPVALGLTFWGASLMGFFAPVPETATTFAATLTVAAGLVWNSRLLAASENGSCSCPACDSGDVSQ